MERRDGFTLVEALVAIFVLAIGLLALLTLFPLGALTMAQAIRDDRAALAAANGMAALQIWQAQRDPDVLAAMTQDPLPAGWPADGPGWPVYVDPVGVLIVQAPYLGGSASTGIRRVSVRNLTGLPAGMQRQATFGWCVLLDDMTWSDQATPALAGDLPGAAIEWEGRTSWAALLRRPCRGSPVTEVSVVVYSGRSLALNPSLNPAGEHVFAVAPAAPSGSTSLTLAFDGVEPALRAGGWVLDATPEPGHGNFYRITDVTPGSGVVQLELETPLRAGSAVTQIVALDDVVQVFDKGTIGP